MNLLLIEPGTLAGDGSVEVMGVAAGHLQNVLRVVPGSTVRVGEVDGRQGMGTVVATSAGRVRLQCTFEPSLPSKPRVDVLLALPRPKVLRRLWAQLAALGVGRILLTNAARVERNYFDTHVLNPPCYRPLLIEGLQQARDTWLPTVSVHRQLKILVEDELDAVCPDAARIVANPGAGTLLAEACRRADANRVLVAIGPEGGWNAYELSLLESHGFTRAGIGHRTLRTDTATIAVLAIAHAALAQDSQEFLPITDR